MTQRADAVLLADATDAPDARPKPAAAASDDAAAADNADLASSAAAQRFVSELLRTVPPDEPLRAASILTRHPALRRHKSVVLDLALEDYCRRTERGEALHPSEFARGFPEYRTAVARVLAVQSYFEHGPGWDGLPVHWPAPGEEFLDYTLREEIGRGAFARVFLANEASVADRPVVVKVCRHHLTEAGTQGRLQHPHIVPVLSVSRDEESGLSAICMPYVGIATLEDVADIAFLASDSPGPAADVWRDVGQRFGPAPAPAAWQPPDQRHPFRGRYVDAVLRIGEALAGALAHTHGRGVCHGDVKPSNVLVAFDGQPMLLDFNLARQAQRPGVAVGGTLPYMAPEQLNHLVDAATQAAAPPDTGRPSDVFSLGVTLFQLLTGRLPYEPPEPPTDQAATALGLLARQQPGPPSLRKLNHGVDWRVERLIHACLAFQPAARPTAAELQRQFAAALTGWGQFRRACGSRRSWWAAVAVAGCLAVPAAVISGRTDRTGATGTELALAANSHRPGEPVPGPLDTDGLRAKPPLSAEAAFERGVALLKAGKVSDALDEFELADRLAVDGRYPAARAYCHGLLNEHLETAADLADQAEAEGFRTAANRANLAYFLAKMNRLDEAAVAARSAIKLNNRFQPAQHLLARIDLRLLTQPPPPPPAEHRRLLDEAAAAADRALELGPRSGALWLDAARIRARAVRAAKSTGNLEAASVLRHKGEEAAIEAARHGFAPGQLTDVLQELTDLPGTPEFQAALETGRQAEQSKEPVLLTDPTAAVH